MIDWVSHGKFSSFLGRNMTIISQILYQQITANYHLKVSNTNACKNTVPADYQQITTDKKNIIILSLILTIRECHNRQKSDKKKPPVSCQDVVDAYHEILPEAPRIRALK